MRPCNRNILDALDQARKLLFLADKGDMQREDEGCGVLYGIIRDCAYRIKSLAEREQDEHRKRGIWDGEKENTTTKSTTTTGHTAR
jgi:hypothetical protein